MDLVSSIAGVTFREAWKSRAREKVKMKRRLCSILFVCLDLLIKNREAVGRHEDFEDLKYLRAAAKSVYSQKEGQVTVQ